MKADATQTAVTLSALGLERRAHHELGLPLVVLTTDVLNGRLRGALCSRRSRHICTFSAHETSQRPYELPAAQHFHIDVASMTERLRAAP